VALFTDGTFSRNSLSKQIVDVRLAVVCGVVLLTVCLTIVFVYAAWSIRKEHEARFRRIHQRLERDAAAIVDPLLKREYK